MVNAVIIALISDISAKEMTAVSRFIQHEIVSKVWAADSSLFTYAVGQFSAYRASRALARGLAGNAPPNCGRRSAQKYVCLRM